jgi:short-subunit dehydrogenase
MSDFYKGKTVWIIGGSQGIGLAVAKALDAQGAHLIISARADDNLKNLSKEFMGTHQYYALDVTDYKSIDAVVKKIKTLDILLFTAGIYKNMNLENFDLAFAQKLLEVNLGGMINTYAALLPLLKKQRKGLLAFISSVAGYRGLPNSGTYGASKAGMTNFAETVYPELKKINVDIKIISPGFVKTRLTDNNPFPMPALLTTEQAAEYIVEGLQTSKFEIHFPKRFTYFLKLLRILPNRLYFWFMSKII